MNDSRTIPPITLPLLFATLAIAAMGTVLLLTDIVTFTIASASLCGLVFLMRNPEMALAIQINGVALYLYAVYKLNIEGGTTVTGAFYGILAISYIIGGWLSDKRNGRLNLQLIDLLFILLYALFFISYFLQSRDNPLAYKKVVYAPVLVVAPYIGVMLINNAERIRRLIGYIALMSIVMIVPAFYELLTNPLYQEYGRFSIYIFEDKGDNPIQFGIAYAILLIVMIFRIAERRRAGLIDIAIILPSVFLLVRSGARGPVISFIVTMFVFLVWLGKFSRRIKFWILTGGAALLITAYSLIPTSTVNFYQVLFDPEVSPTQNPSANSIQERIFLIDLAIDEFLSNPILGVGTGNSSGGVGYPHNSVIEVAAELGLVGLTIFILLHAQVLRTAYFAFRRTAGQQLSWTVGAAFAIYIFSFVESLFSGYMGGDMLLYVSIGLVSSVSRVVGTRENGGSAELLAEQAG